MCVKSTEMLKCRFRDEITMNAQRRRKNYYDVPELPHDKEYHVFICYVSEDFDRVKVIVDNLEERGYKCCDHQRDFTPGESILNNMKEGINKSLNMLIVLSEDFVNSRYCSFEVNEALHMAIQTDYMLIPIKLEPCDIPRNIENYNCINAEEDRIERVHFKVIKAIKKKEVKEAQDKRNGKNVSYPLKPYKRRLSLPRYRLQLTQNDRQGIWDDGFKISDELFDEIEEMVNSSGLVKYKHLYKNRSKIFALLIFLLLQITLAVFLIVLVSNSDNKLQDSPLPAAVYIPIIVVPLLLIVWYCCGFYVVPYIKESEGYIFKFYTQEKHSLNNNLWDKVKGLTRNRTIIVIAVFHKECLRFMEYNMRSCKDFFIRRLSKNEKMLKFHKPQESYKDYTDRVFETFMREKAYMLHEKASVQDNRSHKIATGAKCACHLIEEWLLQ